MEREERSERMMMRGMVEARREMNMNSIVFLLLLDRGQKIIPGFSELQVYIVPQSFFKSNIR